MEYMSPDNPLHPNATRILCCQCAVPIDPNPSNMCVACLRAHVDITEGIPKQATLFFCRGCERYLQPPAEWLVCALESRELLALCLKRLKGLNRVKLVDAGFAWTEPHSKRIKVKLTVQGEVMGGAVLQQTFVVEFVIQHQMCDACHRSEAQDYWRALVQVRQRANNRKTFYYLEQLILKHKAHANTLGIKPKHDGLDFFYASENNARKMVDFIQSVLPVKCQHSKKLISHDIHSNIYNYKFTFSIEIVPLSKDSVVCLPKKLRHQLGSISPICLVQRVTSTIHLIDVYTGQVCDLSSTVYWRYPFTPICNPKQLVEYIVMDIDILKEKEKKSFPGQGMVSNKHVVADVYVVKSTELGMDVNPIHTRTHLGHILKPGDSVLGYNLGDTNVNDANFDQLDRDAIPDVFLVKKHYEDKAARRRARYWKLKRMAEEFNEGLSSTNDDYNEFLDDLEEDPAFRQNINIFKDKDKIPTIPIDTDEMDPSVPRITLAEMLDDLNIEDVEMSEKFTENELQDYFVKFIKKQLSEEENQRLQDAVEIMRRPSYFTPKSYNTNTRVSLDCFLCRNLLGALFVSVKEGQNDEDLIDAITIMCTSLNIESYNVCRGVIVLNLPIFNYIIRNAPEATPGGICALVLQVAGDPNVCPYNDPRFDWQVELPDPVEIPQGHNENATPLTAVIVTDAHIDPYYEAFGVADCGEPTCCRKGQTPQQRDIYDEITVDEHITGKSIIKDDEVMLDLDIAPVIREAKSRTLPKLKKARNSEPAGYWGDYRDCDSPIWAYDDVVENIAKHKNIDVVYYIGDSIDHHIWETTYDMINEVNAYIVNKMRKSLGDDVLVIPVIGNHESQPTNQFAPQSITEENLSTAWLYKALADKWDFYLTDDAKATLLERGEFSMLVRPGLRVISLNNNVAYRYNWWLVYDPLDAKKHLDWLVEELHKAELAGEKVHILAHIPPGVHDLTYTWTREYNRIVNRFSATIAAEFNGHTHSDEFKIFYSLTDGKPISMAWGGGSATAYTHYNLNYKIATINGGTYEPANIVNYVYNLTEANLTPNRKPHWFQLYDIRNSFNLQDLSPESMDRLVLSMVTNNKPLLDLYSAFYSKLSDNRWPFCNNECKLNNLCKTVVTVLWERQKCQELRDLFFL
ncbi:uncharacterized protein [Epargyreus clarus]|uniref:uncharacterized protein n=1 Tax=Epargyreus clarus TaxID=520877 RepID=UPI003C2FB1B9